MIHDGATQFIWSQIKIEGEKTEETKGKERN